MGMKSKRPRTRPRTDRSFNFCIGRPRNPETDNLWIELILNNFVHYGPIKNALALRAMASVRSNEPLKIYRLVEVSAEELEPQ